MGEMFPGSASGPERPVRCGGARGRRSLRHTPAREGAAAPCGRGVTGAPGGPFGFHGVLEHRCPCDAAAWPASFCQPPTPLPSERLRLRSPSNGKTPLISATSFTEAVRAVASELRESAPHRRVLNLAASRIDGLGRQLHGVGFVHDREIADGLTAAIRDLDAAHRLPQEERAETVGRAAAALDDAADRMENGGVAP